MTTPTVNLTVGPSPTPTPSDLLDLSVADITDWLQTFSGPEGQKQLTDQGSIGLRSLTQEAGQLDLALQNIVDLIPGSSYFGPVGMRDGTGARPNGLGTPTVGVNGGANTSFLQKVRDALNSLSSTGKPKPDVDAIHAQIVTLHNQEDIDALPATLRADAAKDLANLRVTLARIGGKPESDDVLQRVLDLLLQPGSPGHQHRPAGPPFQRVILEGDRRAGSGDDADLDRVIQRVVSEAFSQATFLGNTQPAYTSSMPYPTMGTGPVSMYAQNIASIPPNQRLAAAAGLAAQISTDQAVLQQQLGPAVSATLDTVGRIQPLAQMVDFAELAALKSALSCDLNLLLAEAGRADGPRSALVTLYRGRLQDHKTSLSALAGIDPVESTSNDQFDSTGEESQRALLTLLDQQVATIGLLWDKFFGLGEPSSFSRLVIEAQRLLDATSSSTREWIRELDGVGLTQDERRLAIIGDHPASLIQALEDPDVVDLLNTLHGHVKKLKDLGTKLAA